MSFPVKWFHSGMQGAPVLSNNWGDLVGLLDACLVTGFNLKSVDTITLNGTTATANISAGHGFAVNQIILIAGCDQSQYNGEQRVKSITASSVSFDITGSPASPATTQTNITCKVAPIGWQIAFTGTNKRAYRSLDIQSPRHYLRVDDSAKGDGYDQSWSKWANVGICENMTDIDTPVGAQCPYDPNYPTKNWAKTAFAAQWGWYKWIYARTGGLESYGDGGAGARNWILVGDGRFFWLMNNMQPGYGGDVWKGRSVYHFGDVLPVKGATDIYSTSLLAHDQYGGLIDTGDSSAPVYWSYPGQYYGSTTCLPSLSFNGGSSFLKNYTNIGNPERWGITSLNTNNGQQWPGRSDPGLNEFKFPNPPDYALWLMPAYMVEKNSHGYRAILPGFRWIPQNMPYGDMTVIENVQNEGVRKFVMPRYTANSSAEFGQLALDITGPWR